jgi:hypothetical protein
MKRVTTLSFAATWSSTSTLALEMASATWAAAHITPSRPGSSSGSSWVWLTKSGGQHLVQGVHAPLDSCLHKTAGQCHVLFCRHRSSPTCRLAFSSEGSATSHDATRGGLAHRSEPYLMTSTADLGGRHQLSPAPEPIDSPETGGARPVLHPQVLLLLASLCALPGPGSERGGQSNLKRSP